MKTFSKPLHELPFFLLSHFFVFLCFRWRNAFFWSLVFGVPSMFVMMYFMYVYHPAEGDDGVVRTKSRHYQLMLMPGLSLEALLMFAFATPVQVFAYFSSLICLEIQ
jgi:hypothetical protein